MNLTLHPAFRVTDLTASLPFYEALGYESWVASKRAARPSSC